MTQYVFANNVSTTLAAAATTSDTTLTLASSANLPTLTSEQAFPLTLNDAATGQVYEIVYVTAISGVTVTVERARESTSAHAWAVGDYAYDAHTAEATASATGNPNNTFDGADSTSGTQQFIPRKQGDSLYAALTSFGNDLAANGYQELPGGAFIQWGKSGSLGVEGPTTVTFPKKFPSGCLCVVATLVNSQNSPNMDQAAQVVSWNASSATLYMQAMGNGSHLYPVSITWIAIGY